MQRDERVQRHRLGRRARAAAGQHVDEIEEPERVERAEAAATTSAGSQQRQRDRDEPAPAAGAVDARGVVERRVDALQAGEQQDRDERRRLPDVGGDHRHPCGERMDEPVERVRRASRSSGT